MNTVWYTKYRNRPEFMAVFDTEQAYIDAMFVQMIMFNFGVWLDTNELLSANMKESLGL